MAYKGFGAIILLLSVAPLLAKPAKEQCDAADMPRSQEGVAMVQKSSVLSMTRKVREATDEAMSKKPSDEKSSKEEKAASSEEKTTTAATDAPTEAPTEAPTQTTTTEAPTDAPATPPPGVKPIAPFGREDTAKVLQHHAGRTQDTLVDAIENAEVAEIKRSVFRSLTRLRAAEIKEFDTIARMETQAIDEYNDNHNFRKENPLSYIGDGEAPVPDDKLTSFHK